MKAIIARTTAGLESLRIEDIPAPGPIGPGQIRIAIRAASINYRDLMVIS